MRFGKGEWPNFARGIENEWLVTNGLGGYASSTIIGANTRKYHGLLVAALNPPVQRVLMLAKLDERVEVDGRVYNLATNQTVGGVTEYGFIHLQQVHLSLFPVFTYSFADIFLHKQVFMINGENTTVVLYRIHNGGQPAVLRLVPLVNCRDFHGTTKKDQVKFSQQEAPYGVTIFSAGGIPALNLACSAGTYTPKDDWFYGMFYLREQERGLAAEEDHYLPGDFLISLAPEENKTVTFVATLEEMYTLDGQALVELETKRIQEMIDKAGFKDEFARRLIQAADAFIVKRQSTGAKSIIAGYHWFNDWGRDAMIALPGLTLVTGRFEDAREILSTFAAYCKDGLLPNMFPDPGQEPLYNTVDASLWFFQAVYKYLQYTSDFRFVQHLYPVLKEIVDAYIRGTHFNIKMDSDGLIRAGWPQTQLTWMDAKVGDLVVTPRHGKPVEINALWYNALCILRELATRFNDHFPYGNLPAKVKASFLKAFWYAEGSYLYDVVGEGGKDPALRPNQVLAVSLPYTMLNAGQGKKIIRRLWRELYATYGLRSLAPDHPEYRGVYAGDRLERDKAYHQGTVWSWLIGPFITAFRRVDNYSQPSRIQAARFIAPFRTHLANHGVGFISEIFDGNEPVIPRGCIAQAWGVAEVLRAYAEDVLEIAPPHENGGQGGETISALIPDV
ncbi:MAG: amylo-alpha-1,6-glucosidase [Bacillota bacterium]